MTMKMIVAGCLFLLAPECTPASEYMPASEARVNAYAFAKIKPVPHDAVAITGGFWGKVRDLSRHVGVPALLEQFEKHGHIENFRICAAQSGEKHHGGPNCNEFFYKHLEAMGWYAAESPKIAALHGQAARIVLSAQKPDGYLNTFYENPLKKRQGHGRFSPRNRFEFYNFGHFTQAAIAHWRSTGDKALLHGAIRFADLIVARFAAPNQLPYTLYRGIVNQKYEHPNHELALVELYRVTGDRRYLDLVKQTYVEYGYFGGEHFNEMWGHAVQENLLEAGAVDLYLETGDDKIWRIAARLWRDMFSRKMYITGGTGSTGRGEAYGKAHELPNATAYAETCAAIALTFWHHKMLLATGGGRFADEMDRTLYNNVLSGYGRDGITYFYRNPLAWNPLKKRHAGRRFPWHGCPCCPPNLHRLFASLDQYIYTHDGTGVQVNLYVDSSLTHRLPGGHKLKLTQRTDYPWSGRVELAMQADPGAQGRLRLRIPQWCGSPKVAIDGNNIQGAVEAGKGYLMLDRPWAQGKTVTLNLSMQARIVQGNPRVPDQVNRIAILRGPLVYCLEQPDNPGMDLDTILFSKTPGIKARFAPDVLGGVVRLWVSAGQVQADGAIKDVQVGLVPYHAWANREPGRMMVWLPTHPGQLSLE